jgi:hypothetical protein
MKMKFKKVLSVLGVSLLFGATIGTIAIATNHSIALNPDTTIVYGSNAAVSDTTGALNILDVLKTDFAIMHPSNQTNQTVITGETKTVETSSQPLYLGDYMNDTKTTFTKEQLPSVLADGSLSDSDGKDYEYNLKVNVPNAKVVYGETPDRLDPPVIYTDFNSPNTKYDLRIVFPTALDTSKLIDESIRLFGKDYVFSSNAEDLTTQKITLYENSKSLKVDDTTITENGHTFSSAVEDTTHAVIYIDGVSKSVREGYSGKINGVNIYVKDIFGPDYLMANQKRYVEIYINANPLTIENGAEIKKSNDYISGTKAEFITSGGKVSEIKMTVVPSRLDNDTRYIKEGDTFSDPIFGTIKFTMGETLLGNDNENSEMITLKATSDDKVGITFKNRLGNTYDLDILKPSPIMLDNNFNQMYNSTCTTYAIVNGSDTCTVPGTWTYNSTILGFEDHVIIAEINKPIKEGDYFITNSGDYSQIWEVMDIKTDGKIELKDISGGTTTSLSLGSVGGVGSLGLADGSSVTIGLNTIDTIILKDKASNYVYTYNGAKLVLPIDNSGKIQLVEETPYNGGNFNSNVGAQLGNVLNFTWAYKTDRSGKNIFLKSGDYGIKDVNYWSGDVGEDDVYSITKYGTFIQQTGSDDKALELFYPKDAARLNFYIGEQSITTTPITDSVLSNMLAIKDIEIDSALDKNLIIVGGSCINEIAAQLLGSDVPLCGDAFTAQTGVASGQYLIQTFNNPNAPGKVAILVAGYNAEDTTRAIADILNKPMNLSVGSKIIG